jgi:hypothetical protein
MSSDKAAFRHHSGRETLPKTTISFPHLAHQREEFPKKSPAALRFSSCGDSNSGKSEGATLKISPIPHRSSPIFSPAWELYDSSHTPPSMISDVHHAMPTSIIYRLPLASLPATMRLHQKKGRKHCTPAQTSINLSSR